MFDILKKSFVYRFICTIVNFFKVSFQKSFFRKFSDGFKEVLRKSCFFRVVKRYFDKKPLFLSSVTYRAIKFVGRHFGKAADYINLVVIKQFDRSFVKKALCFAKGESTIEKLTAVGLFFMITALAFLVFSVVFGQNYEVRIYISWGLFFVGILTVSAGKHIESAKQSVTFRVVKYIIELVKM